MSNLTIRVEDMNGQQRTIQVNSSWTYAQLHNQFAQMFGGGELSVIFGNKYLSVVTQGTATLEQLRFTNNCVIRVLQQMKGGF
ncbi:unnamed protein product [Blepharisma stoltei]|uniref:Rad60/SUMO-like domain-containing protein n=1 Tax=Blepharisma stoltei TaxID=1481888 RepID=A0AAU9IHI0_9CILI|nr:unnamed protein product [Blepharisma stoltei]